MDKTIMNKLSTVIFGLVLLTNTLSNVLWAQEISPGILRTPDSRFENLPGYNFEPHYLTIDG